MSTAACSAALRRPCGSSSTRAPFWASHVNSPTAAPSRMASTAANHAGPSIAPSSQSLDSPNTSSSAISSQGFFAPSPDSPAAAFSRRSARKTWNRDRAAYHPLVNELLAEVYSTHVSPERVWNAYQRLHTADASGASSGHRRPMDQLRAAHHQLVLRAIAPDVRQAREAKRVRRSMVASSASSDPKPSSSSKFAPPTGYMSKRVQPRYRPVDPQRHHLSVEEYVSRVRFVFQQMRGAPDAHLAPDLSDYNHVLQKLAAGGHLAAITRIWAHLTGRAQNAMAAEGSEDTEAWNSYQPPTPSINTYQSLMLAVSKQLSASLERYQRAMDLEAKVLAQKNGVTRRGGPRAATLRNHLDSSAANQMKARQAAILAAQRALGLIEHMQEHGIRADRMTLDLAMRTLRLAGQLDSVKALLRSEYAVSLDNVDVPLTSEQEVEKRQSVSIHTLNTLLMALGEQATVSEMLAAYETLSRPLPVRRSDQDDDDVLGFDDAVQPSTETPSGEQSSSLFATDFRGLFANDPLPGQEESPAAPPSQGKPASAMADKADAFRPSPISPNARTFRTLLRHSLAPAHAATQLKNGLGPFSRSVATAEEDERRARGAYLPVAKYVVREAVERYESEVQRMAAELGVAVQLEQRSADDEAMVKAAAIAHETAPEEEGEDQIVLPPRHISTQLSSHLSSDFKPYFDPPATGLVPADLRLLVSFSSRGRNVADLVWCASWLDRLLAARDMEMAAVKVAHKLWYPFVNRTESNWTDVLSRLPDGAQLPDLPAQLVQPLLDALNKQQRFAKAELRDLEEFRLNVEKRLRTLRAQNKERIRRRARNRAGANEEKIREMKRREEEKLMRAMIREDEIRRAAEEEENAQSEGEEAEGLVLPSQDRDASDKDAIRLSVAA